jgi:MerR family transcriptional regulator, light-induced transcriptional regulator
MTPFSNPHDEVDPRLSLVQAACSSFLVALVAGDDDAAESVIGELLEADLPLATIDDDVIAPAMREVGRLWAMGTLPVTGERRATKIAFRVMALQRERSRVAGDRGSRVVVLAAPPGEHHVLGLTMAGELLSHAGYVVHNLGADVDLATLAQTIANTQATVVGLTSSGATLPGRALDAIQASRRVRPGIPVLLGGQRIPSAARYMPDAVVCERVSHAVEAVDALVQRPQDN